ncbi:MAG: GNAT family N-acetyltransferase [Nitrospira sp. LK70]|nr:GNAT family N-acetyltransferase [Nitrospira sp. LK70]
MKVTITDSIREFRELRETWNTIYAKDSDANIFDSWAWLSGWLNSTRREWLVLGVQRNGSPIVTSEREQHVAFMALSVRDKESKRILVMGGYPQADHTGFVCLPEYVDEAIPALAAYIRKQLKWDTLQLLNVFDPRVDLFLKHISSMRMSIQETQGASCPYIPLPENWDQYFNTMLGSSTRKGLKNDLNKIRRLQGFHVSEIQHGNADFYIETLLSLWQSRWGLKSDDLYMGLNLQEVINIKRSFLRSCFEDNRLWLNILWDDETPIAGGAVFLDVAKKNFCILKIAANYRYAQYSPGNIWCLYAIQYAIEKGFKICDFGRGTEKYKFSLGSQERFNRNVVVVRMGLLMKLAMSLRSRLQVSGIV